MTRLDCRVAILFALVTQIASQISVVAQASASAGDAAPHPGNGPLIAAANRRLDELKKRIVNLNHFEPHLFNPDDLRRFLNDDGPVAANRFLNQRNQNVRRAFSLTRSALKWRKDIGLSALQASDFPCDLYKMGLIFEHGRAHHRAATGQYVETNPVIWLRLGALGSIVKQLEKLTPGRVISYAYNAPRNAINRMRDAVRRRRRSRKVQGDFSAPMVKDLSAQGHETLAHVLKSIAWWINDWVERNPSEERATLVLDFENTDFAFASWSVGEFLIKLDDLFPDLFDQIIGFRYKPKLWSLHSPISMFNRIFKSRVASSPETDRKLKFVTTEPQISSFLPRVDAQGYTMLPAHVLGTCSGPDDSKSPTGCQDTPTGGNGLYNPGFWTAIYNEFYYSCAAKPRGQ